MTFKQLEYYLAFASCLNYTNAAKMCFTTQPNLGRQIEKLEQELDTKLVLRVNGKYTLSDTGRILQEKGTQLLSFYNEILAELSTCTKPDITFGYTTRHALMDTLREYVGNEFCGHRINWVHGTGDVLINAGLLDMCFTFASPPEYYLKLDDAEIYALVPRSLSSASGMLEPTYFESRSVMLPAGNLREVCLEFFREFNIHPNIREFPYVLFDKSVYLEELKATGSIGFAPSDDYRMYESSFALSKISGMKQTIPIGIQWSEKKDHDCSFIARKLASYAQKLVKTFPPDLTM